MRKQRWNVLNGAEILPTKINQIEELRVEVVKRMKKKGLKENDIFDKGSLNVETIYRKDGWNVEYDKPGYNESYDASFKFSRKNKK